MKNNKFIVILAATMMLSGISVQACDCACINWDDGTDITGTISVSNAVLCQKVTHNSYIVDPDHWCCACGDGTVGDTITYSWYKSSGTNPQTGTFTPPTSGDGVSSVEWTAPPCTGTVSIGLVANDKAVMVNPCPGSETDDNLIVRSGTANVTLPSGCTTGTKSAALTSVKTGSPDCSGGDTGVTGPLTNLTKSISAKYENNECKWVFAVSANKDCPCGVCPGNFTEITDGNDSDLNASNYCDIVNGFRAHAYATYGGAKYGHPDCTQDHEDEHYRIFDDYLSPNAEDWLEARSSMELAIDCSDSNTTTCGAAESYRDSTIEADINTTYTQAFTWMDPAAEEAQCRAAAGPCYDGVADSICSVWDPTGTNCAGCP
jgi:ribosomal protein L37E